MLKNKLKRRLPTHSNEDKRMTFVRNIEESNASISEQPKNLTSKYFAPPLWKTFYDLECELNNALEVLHTPSNITYTYNPLIYAEEVHCAYLRKFLTSEKHLMFVGMNPGPNGMGQNGVPFGNTSTVRDLMKLSGAVKQPSIVHPKRPITGLACTIEEPSGVRLWTLLQNLSGSLETFSLQCFVHNFCPLAFFNDAGKNITPSELKGDYKDVIRQLCINTLEKQIGIVQPEIIVAIGSYVYDCLKKSKYWNNPTVRCLQLPHPSPRSLNNTNWPEKAENFLVQNDLIKYLKNQI